jgi:amino acid transporter
MVLAQPPVGTGFSLCKFMFLPTQQTNMSSLFTAGTLTGFDAAGHIAEETKNARCFDPVELFDEGLIVIISIVAARGIFTSAVATALCGFATTILFLFCTPDIEILYTLSAPQPFVQIYDLALGRGGAVFMTLLAVLGLILVRTSLLSSWRIELRCI